LSITRASARWIDSFGKSKGMRAIVTGAASGIGRAVAIRLNADAISRKDHPARLVLADIAAEPLEAVAKELREAGAEVVTVVADLSNSDTPARVVEVAARQFGELDALTSNAGIIHRATLLLRTNRLRRAGCLFQQQGSPAHADSSDCVRLGASRDLS
jgi:NAD(P)-dependent dehydrogenase (short-subunit alcohol dehydrogenase family)